MALSGSIATSAYTTSSGKTRTVVLSWTATQNVPKNTTTINWVLKGGGTDTGWVQVSELRVTIDGSVVYSRSSSVHTECYNGTQLAEGSKTVTHGTDGSKKVSMKVEAGIYNWAINKSGSKTFTLDTIPRASTIGATDANIGSTSTITVNKKASSYTHSISYTFGDLTGYVTSSGGTSSSESKFSDTSVAFKVPTKFYTQIPNKTSGTCELTIKTYSGTTQIGSSQSCEFKAVADKATCSPTVSGTVIDSNPETTALTGDPNKIVRYMSTALCTITAGAKNSSSISSKKIGGTAVTENTRSISAISSSSVSFQATDSRGYSSSVSVKFNRIDYVKLTSNPSVDRTDPTSGDAVLTFSGSYFNGSFGASSNSLVLKYKVGSGSYIEVAPTLNGNAYSASVDLSGLDYQSTHKVTVVVKDSLMSSTKTLTVKQGIPVFDWGAEDFRVNAFLRLRENSYGVTLPSTGKKGQVFFELQPGGGYLIRIHDGSTWV